MLQTAAFVIAGFLFGLFIFTLVWAWPRTDWSHERETVRNYFSGTWQFPLA